VINGSLSSAEETESEHFYALAKRKDEGGEAHRHERGKNNGNETPPAAASDRLSPENGATEGGQDKLTDEPDINALIKHRHHQIGLSRRDQSRRTRRLRRGSRKTGGGPRTTGGNGPAGPTNQTKANAVSPTPSTLYGTPS
jgi:hypothetical protein